MLKVSGLNKPIYVIPLYSMSPEAVAAPINIKRDSLEMCVETDVASVYGLMRSLKLPEMKEYSNRWMKSSRITCYEYQIS